MWLTKLNNLFQLLLKNIENFAKNVASLDY